MDENINGSEDLYGPSFGPNAVLIIVENWNENIKFDVCYGHQILIISMYVLFYLYIVF